MATINGVEQGVSTYSYTQQFIERPDFGIDTVLKHVADLGVRRFELVGAQTFGAYPVPEAREIDEVLESSEKHGLEPFSYGGYVDLGRITGYRMSEDDILSDIHLDIMTTKALGAKYMRGSGISAQLLPRVAELAERHDVTIGLEIHAPHTPSDPSTLEYMKVLEKLGTTRVGLVPDFGMFIERPTEIAINRYVELGADRDRLEWIIENRHNGMTEEEMQEHIASRGGGEGEKIAISEWFGYLSFAPADIEGFAAMVPYVSYVHGKFYHVNEDLDEPTIPYAAAMQTLVKGGFTGVFLSEYEGHAFYLDDADEQLRRHLAMGEKILTDM
ncbi:TIM barrel protein [Nanchangia anserum]|uniref:TIM barrel protein n=1 Tax=Nanchangia anserum TaxID=2692125 RepID=A0A8I0GF81_9ACTO|nr:TIM barrel protein [Nanchangia anserum]MBD3689742.1 TIM barrel protein [Nanchangia anserum]QOX81913.1 TIM barrel protein [Nanchangia anserum]